MPNRSLLFAVPLFVFAACADDLTKEKQTWETTTQGWATKVEKLKKDQAALNEKMKTLVTLEGDLAGEKDTLDKSIGTAGTAITDAEKALATAKESMQKLITNGKKVPVQVALGTTKSAVDGVLGRADSLLIAADGAIDTLNKKVADAKAAGARAKQQAEAWAAEVKKKGGALNPAVKFKEAEVDVEKSKAELANLVTSLKACAELKTELSVTAVTDTADLAGKRAEALKKYLVDNGVDAKVIVKTAGEVLAEGDDAVKVAITTPCK